MDADAGRQVDAVDGDGFRFQDEMERPLAVDGDGWTDGRMDGWMDAWMDGNHRDATISADPKLPWYHYCKCRWSSTFSEHS